MRASFLFLFSLLFLLSHGQQDTIAKKNPFTDALLSNKIDARFIEKKLEKDNNSTDYSYLFGDKQEKLPLSINTNINKYFEKTEEPQNMLIVKTHEDEEDVIVVKHFNGNNTTNKNFKASQNLGTIRSNTKFVRIAYRDFGLEDGDRVKVYLDKKPVATNVFLSNDLYTLQIDLDTKGYHQIDIEALNQGIYGPNTAEFIVYDDKGNVIMHKAWDLTTGKIATLGIVRF